MEVNFSLSQAWPQSISKVRCSTTGVSKKLWESASFNRGLKMELASVHGTLVSTALASNDSSLFTLDENQSSKWCLSTWMASEGDDQDGDGDGDYATENGGHGDVGDGDGNDGDDQDSDDSSMVFVASKETQDGRLSAAGKTSRSRISGDMHHPRAPCFEHHFLEDAECCHPACSQDLHREACRHVFGDSRVS